MTAEESSRGAAARVTYPTPNRQNWRDQEKGRRLRHRNRLETARRLQLTLTLGAKLREEFYSIWRNSRQYPVGREREVRGRLEKRKRLARVNELDERRRTLVG
jgi:hypothetical protein